MKKKKIGIRVRNRIWAAILAAALMTGQGVISGDSYASVARAEEQVYSSAVEGDGSPENPYLLDSDADLREMAVKLNAKDPAWIGKSYVLEADIQMKKDSFPMIDNFTGMLDGQGYTISGLTLCDEPQTVSGEYRICLLYTSDAADE